MNILITGATGFIGKRLTEKFLQQGHQVYILVRRQSLDKARRLFEDKSNVHLIVGDVSNNDVLETMAGIESLPENIDSLVHLAAIYDLEVSLASAYANNVVGTQNVIYLMQRMKGLKYYHHISTYAVSGIFDGDFNEEQLEPNAVFPDFYARTKMQAEYLVRHAHLKDTRIRIYRPGVIIGDSRTGEMDKVDGPYYFLRLFNQLAKYKNLLPVKHLPLSCHASSTLPLLPVDTLVDWLFTMISSPTQDKVRGYHLVPDEKIYITDFVARTLDHYGINMKVQRVPFPQLYAKVLPALRIPRELVPYMQSRTKYQKNQIKSDFPQLSAPKLQEYLPTILNAAQEMFL